MKINTFISHCVKRKVFFVAGCVIVFSSSIVLVRLKYISQWMETFLVVRSSMPDDLNVVMSFAGAKSRDRYAITLLDRFSDAEWILSGRNKSEYLAVLDADGIDTGRIIFVDHCQNTLDEVRFLKKYLKENNKIHNVGLVSSPLHMRRIKMFVEGYIGHGGETDYKFIYLPVPKEFPGSIAAKLFRKEVIREWVKIIAYCPMVVIYNIIRNSIYGV